MKTAVAQVRQADKSFRCRNRRGRPCTGPAGTVGLILRHLRGAVLGLLAVVAAAQPPEDCGRILGRVVSAEDGRGLPLCHATLVDLDRSTTSDGEGFFVFLHVPAGPHFLRVSHLGFRDHSDRLLLDAGDSLVLELALVAQPLALAELSVEGERERVERLHEPALRLRAAELQREQGMTLAATLDRQTGIASRSMGPAPARPVLRGHSGERLLLLADGASTGDLSATSADHAVAIEPLAARSVDWIRGAETLLYASGAAGGVLDVEQGLVPSELRLKPTGSAALSAESGNRGLGGALRLDASAGLLAWNIDGTLRRAGDAGTPRGRLANSELRTGGLSTGLALIGDRFRIGAAGTIYRSDYGIPGGFVGGHPQGVDIELARRNLRLSGDWRPRGPGLRFLRGSLALARYGHGEYESSGLLGIEFAVESADARLEAGLGPWLGFREGRIVAEGGWRDFSTGGLSHAPDTDEQRLALAWLEHALLPGGWHLRLALRGEHKTLSPDRERVSLVVGHIRERRFGGAAAALQLDTPAWSAAGWRFEAGGGLQRSWRPPTVEELFSGGPHLAAYSYEVGNPELAAERGWLADGSLEARRGALRLRVSAHGQRFEGYIFPSFSGRLSPRRADLYEYRSLGRDAILGGIELDGDWRRGPWSLLAGASLLRGDLVDGGPLPAVPPPGGRLRLEHRLGDLSLGLQAVGALAQERLYQAEDPAALPEERSAGWLRLDLDLGWRLAGSGRLQQLDLRLENALDREYRNHLSRIRSVMPEAGRSLRLAWRVWW
jgi:iron complex outermembrane recepter protein